MEAITTNLYDSLKKYYNHLFNTGYMSPSDTEKLLVYTFIEEIFEFSLLGYVTEEDYLTIGDALNCLYDTSCILPHPDTKCSSYFSLDALYPLHSDPRETEDGLFRAYEGRGLRETEYDTF